MKCLVLLVLLCCPTLSFGQAAFSADSLHLSPDSLQTDSLRSPRDTSSVNGIDTLVTYSSADSIVYSMSTKTMTLYNRAQINYRQMQLKSEQIHINWNTATMTANGVPDTSDTTKKKYRDTPIMKDGGEEYHGFGLSYNFKSKKGMIDIGDTHLDEGYYHGEEIKRAGPDVLFVADGRYTTCDQPDPHYYFASPKMKVIPGDKVVAEPVYLYVSGVPLFALPFGVFPNHGGRRSGIIAPAIVEDATHGRLLHHLGYYWAISDYMDANLRTDLYTKGSWALYSDYRYNLRYYFNGSLSGQYKKLIAGEGSDPGRTVDESYQLNFTHNQDIDPTTRMNVNFTFASNNSYRATNDLEQALNQLITSNATLSKSWEGSPNSVTLNISRQQNLQNGNITEVLPSVSFNHSQSYPFRFGKSIDAEGGAWYEQIGLSYSASATNNRAKISTAVNGIRTVVDGRDTVETITDFRRDRSQSINQNVGLGISPKLGYITISPSLSYSDQRTFSSSDLPTRNASDSSLIFTGTSATQRNGTLSSGVSLSTKLYGIVQPGIFGIAAVRHTFTPNLSFTYRKQIIGTNLAPKDMLVALNVGNIFEMKTEPSEEGKEGNKIQLLNLGAGIAYNFSLDSLNFSPLSVDYRTNIGSFLDIAGNANFDLYKLVQTGPASYVKVNKFLLSEEGRLARLTDFSINLSTALAGEKSSSSSHTASADTTGGPPVSGYYGLYRGDVEPDFSIPWKLSLQFSYAENKVPLSRSRSASVRGGLEFNLTENWKFSMNGGYDIVNREVVVPNINISRDLHCWLMNFSWVPTGAYRSYQFEIRVKAPQLRDIKVTKQGSDRGIY